MSSVYFNFRVNVQKHSNSFFKRKERTPIDLNCVHSSDNVCHADCKIGVKWVCFGSNFNKFVSSQFTEKELDWLIDCLFVWKSQIVIVPIFEGQANKWSQRLSENYFWSHCTIGKLFHSNFNNKMQRYLHDDSWIHDQHEASSSVLYISSEEYSKNFLSTRTQYEEIIIFSILVLPPESRDARNRNPELFKI